MSEAELTDEEKRQMRLGSYFRLVKLAREGLGLEVPRYTRVDAVKRLVEAELSARLTKVGIVNGVTIRYTTAAPSWAGKSALVTDATISWNQEVPVVKLVMEGKQRTHTYYALHVLEHAAVEQ